MKDRIGGIMKAWEVSNRAGSWESFCRNVYQMVDLSNEARRARNSCRRQLKGVNGGLRGSKALYEKEVLSYWSKYGIKPKKMWYDLYCFADGEYDPRYIPEELYWQKIYPALNRVSFRNAYTDKNFYTHLFPYLKHPRTILSNRSGGFFDTNGNAISRAYAASLIQAEKRYVVKPSIYSGEGVDISFIDADIDADFDAEVHKRARTSGDSEPNIDVGGNQIVEVNPLDLFRAYGSDFIVQDIVTQHDTLAQIHSESLNTIRTISFLYGGDVHISSSILRMGVSGSRLDNVSAGGLACPIDLDGKLSKYAVDRKSQRFDRHPGGTVFEGLEIPSYKRVLDCIRRAHRSLPYFRIIGWDFAIDKEGDPVFIEYNGGPGLNQVSCGPLFGDLTDRMLDMIFTGKDEFSY